MKLALAIIVKDELDEIKRILKDYYSIFDEVHIAVDFNFAEFEKLKESYPNLHVYQYTWQKDFAHKRNFLASNIEAEYYFRMDCDDTIVNPEAVRNVAEKAARDKISIVYSFYEYAFDQDGNIIAGHYRETIIRNDGNLIWNKPVHENLLPKDEFKYRFVMDKSFRIRHQKSIAQEDTSALRNIEILIDEYKRDGKNTDPRTIAYLGRNFLGVGEYDKAKYFLVRHIQSSGWDEDRYMSRLQLAECHLHANEIEEAKLCCMEAIMELPENPDAYLKLHDIYFELSDWKKAIYWGKIGMEKNPPEDSVMLYDPSSLTWRPAITMAYAYFQTNEYEKAWALFQYAKKLAPSIDFIVHNENMFKDAIEHKNFAERFLYLANYIKEKCPDKIKQLFDILPHDMDDNAYIQRARNKMLPPKTWGDKSVVIYCGPVLEEWYDKSVETGIGGSEEAVIYMSRELTKLGYNVTVFNGCGANEGIHNGVDYQSYVRFNPRDTFNIIISWRMSIFAMPVKSQQSWVWFHDVVPTKNLPKEHLLNIDKVLVLSNFHKSLLPSYVPESKILVSSNGINEADFAPTGVMRQPHRAIYASSYDRGLEELLTIWPRVRAAIPDAELYIYYGWNNIDKMIKSGDYKIAAFKEKMLKLLDQPGVHECGRIGHKELIAEYQKSSIYAYPCTFEEISCISAMKAQACGCYAVTTDYAALSETVQSGIKIAKGDDYAQRLIEAMLNHEQITYVPTTWADVAEEWSKQFSSTTPKVMITDRLGWIRSQCKLGEKIVDIGGNDGHTFGDWNRSNITTVDIDLYDIPNFVRADAHNLPMDDKQFDVAVLAEILEHVDDPIKVIKEAMRVAKRVVITVPNEHEWKDDMQPFQTVESDEERRGMNRLELAKHGNPKCKEFYMEDNLQHLWHSRHYTEELLAEHIKLSGATNFTINKLVLNEWRFFGATIIC